MILPTIEVTDGKRTIRVNASEKSEWAQKGWKPADAPKEKPEKTKG